MEGPSNKDSIHREHLGMSRDTHIERVDVEKSKHLHHGKRIDRTISLSFLLVVLSKPLTITNRPESREPHEDRNLVG